MAPQIQCPVCGESVDPQTAPSASYDDQTYSFSSDDCRERFLADPGSFVGNTGS